MAEPDYSQYGRVSDAAPDYSAYGSVSEKPEGGPTISAVPPPEGLGGKLSRWAENVAHDLKYGTDLTGVGTVLQKMGAHGLASGNSEKVAEFMGSLPLGLLQATKGAGEVPSHPWQGAKDIAGGIADAATIPAALIAPPGAAEGAAELIDAIPNKARAAENLGKVMGKVGASTPVNIDAAAAPAIRAQELADVKFSRPAVVKDVLQRVSPGAEPTTFRESSDIASNLGKMSADEKMSVKPQMKAQINALAAAFRDSNQAAADAAGVGDLYRSAIKEYGRASRMENAMTLAKKYVMRGAAAAALGAAGTAGYDVYKTATGGK